MGVRLRREERRKAAKRFEKSTAAAVAAAAVSSSQKRPICGQRSVSKGYTDAAFLVDFGTVTKLSSYPNLYEPPVRE